MKKLLTYSIAGLIMLLTACDENTTYRSSVPAFPVRMELNILGEYPHFIPENPLQYLTFTKPRYEGVEYVGYAGLLVYTGLDRNYHAFDLACPHCLNRQQVLQPDGMYAICPVCEEQYDISYGLAVPTKGISNEALRKYTTRYDNTTGKLYISQ